MSIKAKPSFSLKDQLFNPDSVGKLASGIHAAYAAFDRANYERTVLGRFPELELKERIHWMVLALEQHLPEDFLAARNILLQALPEPLDPDKNDDDFGEFIWIVPGEFVARQGCTSDYLADSLDFLREATKRFSSEGAIRPFLKVFPEETMEFVRHCAADSNYHVRRLASEGIRPFLPWAIRAEVPIGDIIGVLDRLHADATRYVTRSVANTLNDISRIEPDSVIRTLKRWRKNQRQRSDELTWMTRHALRTLLKTDYLPALSLLGYATTPKFRVSNTTVTDVVKVGKSFEWRCTLNSQTRQKLKINLRIHFLKSNGRHSSKVFAVKDGRFQKGETIQISAKQPFKPITTRTLYPGPHYAELVVNGIARKKMRFELVS